MQGDCAPTAQYPKKDVTHANSNTEECKNPLSHTWNIGGVGMYSWSTNMILLVMAVIIAQSCTPYT